MTRNLAQTIPILFLSMLTAARPALATDSVLVGWGLNADGQSTIPPGLGVIVQIAAGEAHSVVLRADGTVYCWGWNPYGQCDVPAGLPPIRRIDAGYNGTIALGWDGRVRCWGVNVNGECNVPTTLENVVQVAGGGYHNVALRSDGVIVGWGWNGVGQITTPAGIGPVKAIGAGHAHTIAVREDGTVWCWGRNDSTECNVPPNVSGVVEVSSGGFNSLARGADGTAFAWGNPGWTQGTVPPGGEIAKQVAGGHYHSMILRPDRTVVTWGGNWEGQGVTPPGLKNVAYIAAGGYHNLALLAADEDGDGIDNTIDNCVFTANPSQLDADGDGIGDACDFPDCNGDGISDFTQCRDGTLTDFNSNDIPDCCEQGTPCVVGIYPVQWRVKDGGNGHWYQWKAWGSVHSLADAVAESNALGGHLATLTTVEEESFVRVQVPAGSCIGPAGSEALIGLVQAEQAIEPAGGWSWITGEAFEYSNWRAGEPNDAGNEDACLLNVASGWNDGSVAGLGCSNAAIYEWSADCNGDGIVDLGQCRDGTLPDANRNGIPDACECPADLNRDGNVSASDLPLLLNAWGSTGNTSADVDGDGFVGPSDLAIVLGSWGPCSH